MADLPAILGSAEIVNLVDSVVNTYKETKINAEIQKTEREKVIQQARVFIAQYENDTQRAIAEIQATGELNLRMIEAMEKLLMKQELDENSVKLCETILDKLR